MKEKFKYLTTRPYWNSDSHPATGEVGREWLISHYCYVFYNRELTEEEIQKYQIIPTYLLERMVGKTYSFEDVYVKVIKVDGFFVKVQMESEGIKDSPASYHAMEVFEWSKELELEESSNSCRSIEH